MVNPHIFRVLPRFLNIVLMTLISGFRRDIDEICALLGYYAASCGNCLPKFRDNISVPFSLVKSPCRNESRPITQILESTAG
jgi:hypothetical protein